MLPQPGESLLMDHIMAHTPGRLPNTFGKEPLQIVDHAAEFIQVYIKLHWRLGETLRPT